MDFKGLSLTKKFAAKYNLAMIFLFIGLLPTAKARKEVPMPLTFVSEGELVEVKKIGGNDDSRRHLHNLGFVEGSRIKVISRTNGNLIVGVKDSRIALSKEMAAKVVVTIIS